MSLELLCLLSGVYSTLNNAEYDENVIGTPQFVSSFIKTITNVIDCRMMVLYPFSV